MRKIIIISIFILSQFYKANAQADTENIKNVVYHWTEALNNHDINKLQSLYSAKLLFYCEERSNNECVTIKSKALNKSPNFKQTIVSDIKITSYESGIIKCDFTKQVSSKKGPKDYASYLLIKMENGSYHIVGEGDKITDERLNYNLNLGNQITVSTNTENPKSKENNSILYIIIGGVVLGLLILFYFIKNKTKANSNPTENIIENERETFSSPIPEQAINNVSESVIETTSINTAESNEETKKDFKTKEYLNQAFTQTTTAITKLFNAVDSIDRALYDKRMKFFILGSVLILIIAPILDILFEIKKDWFTFYSTFAFFIFNLILFLSLISSWRDDTGNWSFKRAKSKLQTYFDTLKDTVETTRTNSQDETLYKLGQFLFFGGVGWKALQNVSVFVRKPIEYFNLHLVSFRKFEKFTNSYYWIPIILGLGIIIYLYNKNPKILQRIKNELRQLFGFKQSENSKYSEDLITVITNPNNEFVINAKTEQQITTVIASSNSNLFSDFAIAIQNWNPRGCYYEYEYQDRLARHLTKLLPDATIKTEFPIGDKALGNRGRADIVINDTILIELKRDSSVGAIQRAKGQISQYSEIWQNRGPVILLLCDYDYEHARLAYSSTMTDLARLERPVLTIVAKAKKTIA